MWKNVHKENTAKIRIREIWSNVHKEKSNQRALCMVGIKKKREKYRANLIGIKFVLEVLNKELPAEWIVFLKGRSKDLGWNWNKRMLEYYIICIGMTTLYERAELK